MANKYDEFDEFLLGGVKLTPFEPGTSSRRRKKITAEEKSFQQIEYQGKDYALLYQMDDDKAVHEVSFLWNFSI